MQDNVQLSEEYRLDNFRRKSDLMQRKIIEYLPAMTVTNLSTLLLVNVDTLVVGNFSGKDAFVSVSIFNPMTMVIGVLSVLTALGIGTSMSTAMGSNDRNEIRRIRGTSVRLIALMAVIISVVQIPVVWLMIRSYDLSPEVYRMTWQYAAGIMICSPLGLISTAGVFQLQISGRMKVLMKLAVAEGLSNLLFDLLFVALLHMGAAGAGYGTVCANLIRCIATVIYISRYTDMYNGEGYRPSAGDYVSILRRGIPEASYSLVMALQGYIMMRIILEAFGSEGGIIRGVCAFCLSIANVFISGLQGSMRPLVGLLTGAGDHKGLSQLMRHGFRYVIAFMVVIVLIIELFPALAFRANGFSDVSPDWLLSVRLYALVFVFNGMISLLNLYMSNRGEIGFVTRLNFAGSILLPAIAYVILMISPGPYIWASYLLKNLLVLGISWNHFRKMIDEDKRADKDSRGTHVLYLSIKPGDAAEASEAIRRYADSKGVDKKLSYNAALCVEEMGAYVAKLRTDQPGIAGKVLKQAAPLFSSSDKTADENGDTVSNGSVTETAVTASSGIKEQLRPIAELAPSGKDVRDLIDAITDEDPRIQITVRFSPDNEGVVIVLDDGDCIAFDKREDHQKLTADNYELIRRIAKSIEYQYMLDLNYTTIRI